VRSAYEQDDATASSGSSSSEDCIDVLHKYHAFMHLSYQEYLMALSLHQQLHSDTPATVRSACEFLASVRNDPRYLSVLSFLAAKLARESATLPAAHAKRIMHRFWTSLVCNVDGVLEFGVRYKAFLLMSLLERCKVGGALVAHVPAAEAMVVFIENTVLGTLTNAQDGSAAGASASLEDSAGIHVLEWREELQHFRL
jgi:hypothetical protein